MELKKCRACAGSGKIMGGGMMIKDCHECNGIGKISEIKPEPDIKTIKQTESYRQAKSRLMEKSPDLTNEEAEKLLDDAFEREKPRKKRKRILTCK